MRSRIRAARVCCLFVFLAGIVGCEKSSTAPAKTGHDEVALTRRLAQTEGTLRIGGLKDTVKVFPGFVNRFVIRWAPQATLVGGVQPGQNLFSFDPTTGPGYVVHCHILDHEDNEMMRPYLPTP